MVSVIVPAFNAEKTLSKCLKAILKQDYIREYEVIVVDDGSTDSTPDIVSAYEKIRLIRQKNAGPAAARNSGASHARGELILFTDSDCFPEQNWISEMIKPFDMNDGIVGVKGAYKTVQKEITARFVQVEYEDKYNYMMKNESIDFIDTYSAGFKKNVFLEMKGYDTEFPVACAEDIEFSYRLSNNGYKMVFNPKAIVYHIHPDKIFNYLKKKYKFAYWRIAALKKNPNKTIKDSHTPQIMKLQFLFPPFIFGGSILSVFFNNVALPTLLLLLLFILTTLPFTYRVCNKNLRMGLLSPIFLFARAIAQFTGVMARVIYILKTRIN